MKRSGKYITVSEPGKTRNRRWRIVRGQLPQNQHETNWGVCDYDKHDIVLHTPLSAIELLRTLIHEAAHVAAPDLAEHAIERIEATVAAALLPYLGEISDDLAED